MERGGLRRSGTLSKGAGMKRPVTMRPGQTIVITPLEALLVHDDIRRREDKEMAARARQKHGPRGVRRKAHEPD